MATSWADFASNWRDWRVRNSPARLAGEGLGNIRDWKWNGVFLTLRIVLNDLTLHLAGGQALSDSMVRDAVAALINENIPAEDKAGFLIALARKGETAGEIAAFARALREKAVPVPLDPQLRHVEILDVVGTGGDRLSTFNISTTVALIAASAGVYVAKHGNRAVTSMTGSADVMESLGVRLDMSPEEAARSLKEHHFAFFFAPKYHPAFKFIAPARKLCAERGERTIFNFLGPLLNPVGPTAHLIGVPRPDLCKPMASVLQSLETRRAMVVCGSAQAPASVPAPGAPGRTVYLDELSTLGTNSLAEFYHQNALSFCELDPRRFPVGPARLEDLRGGDREVNARLIRAILSGEEQGPKRDIVLLNASAALLVGGRCQTMSEGWALADELLRSGAAAAKLRELARG
jgi:anthranilate phosphoribosyltransferase